MGCLVSLYVLRPVCINNRPLNVKTAKRKDSKALRQQSVKTIKCKDRVKQRTADNQPLTQNPISSSILRILSDPPFRLTVYEVNSLLIG